MSTKTIPFPSASGKGLKIAVIDSGVQIKNPHIIARTSGILVGEATGDWSDSLGHGTAVMAAIQEKAPSAEYLAIKLFDGALAANSTRLIEAIEIALENGVDLINLSLGTFNMATKPAFESLVQGARQSGVLMICARSNNQQPMLPGILEGVVSVDVNWQLDRHSYRQTQADDAIYYLASGFPRPLPGIPPAHNLKGISFAVANMTGIVARAIELCPSRSLDDLHSTLAAYAPALEQ